MSQGGEDPMRRAVSVSWGAAREGFDWTDATGPRIKVDEELGELDEAITAKTPTEVEAELGDVLFALVNLARHLGVDPGEALSGTINRFERRLDAVRAEAEAEGRSLAGLSADELETRWQAAKRRLRVDEPR